MSYILATGLYNEETINLTITCNTIFDNLNYLSTNTTLNINNLKATSTSILNDLNSFQQIQH